MFNWPPFQSYSRMKWSTKENVEKMGIGFLLVDALICCRTNSSKSMTRKKITTTVTS